MADEFSFPNNPGGSRGQCNQGQCQERTCWISPHPFFATGEDSSVSGQNRLMFQPPLEIFGQRESGRVPALWVLLETLEANGREIAIDLRIPQARLSRLRIK